MNRTFSFMLCIVSGVVSACSQGGQFAAMRTEQFAMTPVTQSDQQVIAFANPSTTDEQHLVFAGFDQSSNAAGHFRIDSLQVGNKTVQPTDIAVPPGSTLKINVTYAPNNLETTIANYGGWITGVPPRWEPTPISDLKKPEQSQPAQDQTAVHRALLQLIYDLPTTGIQYVQLVGSAIPGPNGEVVSGGKPGECTVGDGVACYTGGFAVDIPKLLPGGPRNLQMNGAVKLTMSGGGASIKMEDFPVTLMYLKSEDIPQLPSGVSATLILSGAPGVTAQGTFDGSRLELSGVAFRIRVVLGEIQPETVSPGMSAIVDFVMDNISITTIEPYTHGDITLHFDTTLSNAPTGNSLFDQYLANAKVIVTMKGQLAF